MMVHSLELRDNSIVYSLVISLYNLSFGIHICNNSVLSVF